MHGGFAMTATNRYTLAQRLAAACALALATAFFTLLPAPQAPAATLNYNNPACGSITVSGTPPTQTVTCVPAGGGAGAPVCTPTAIPAAPTLGQSTTISANCTNQPTSYLWAGGACLGLTTATCKVSKLKAVTVTYSVTATNAAGAGTPAQISVTWQ
jgi:hypothetical protein